MPSTATRPQVGEKWSRVSFGEIVSVNTGGLRGDFIRVRNESGLEWDISKEIFDKEFALASQYSTETTCNRTELIQTIKSHQRVVMSVNFNKAVKDRDAQGVIKALVAEALENSKMPKVSVIKQALAEATTGQERTMVGRHSGGEDDRGRIYFHDMEETGGPPVKTVDPRTVNWAIINGTKYVVT